MRKVSFLYFLFVLFPFISSAQQKAGKTFRSYAERIADENGLKGVERENYIDLYINPNKYSQPENEREQILSACGTSAGTNIGFELGNYTGWEFSGGTNLRSYRDSTAFSLSVGTKTILSGGTDPISAVSLVSPLGGTKIIKLNDNTNNAQVTSMKTKFKVTSTTTLLKTAHALVFQYAGHECKDNPYIKIQVLGCDESTVLHEFYSLNQDGACPGINKFAFTGAYTPWHTLCFDLSPYLGQTVTLKVAVGDCVFTGHYGYAYFDAGLYSAGSSAFSNSITINSLSYPFHSNFDFTCFNDPCTISAPNGASSYSWVTSSTGYGSQSITTSNEGYYSLAMSFTTGCNFEKHWKINLSPTVSINSGTTSACLGSAYTLTASGAATYTWFPSISTATILSIASSASVVHTLTGSSQSKVCKSSATQSVTIYPTPTISVSGNASVCIGSPISIGASGASSYTWSTGANTPSITVSPSVNTTYTVNGTSLQGCKGTTKSVTIQAVPTNTNVFALATKSVLCVGDSTLLSSSIGQSSYLWSSGATTYSTYVKPTSTTIYSVSIGSTCGPVTKTVQVTVNSPSGNTLTVTSPATVCTGGSFPVSASGFSSYTYTFGTNTYSGSSITASVNSPTTTNFSVTATDAGGCKTMSVFPISAAPMPTLSISGPTLICFGQTATLTASGANTYTWTNSSFTPIGTGPTLTVSPFTVSTYFLLGADANGCQGPFANHTVKADPASANIGVSSVSICVGATVSLSATMFSTPTTYSWSTGTTTQSTVVSPTVTTTYTVDVNNSLCGTMTATRTITVSPLPYPTVSITGTSSVACTIGGYVSLTASGASSYTWSTSYVSPTVNVTNSTPGVSNYYVIGANSAGCKAMSALYTVTFIPSPLTSISGASIMCAGSTSVLTASGASTYSWNTGPTTNTLNISPVSSPTTFSVTGTATNGCSSSASKLIYLSPMPTLSINCVSNPICPGNLSLLNVYSADYYNFLWSNGSIQDTAWVAPSSTTSYSCTSFGPYCNVTKVITVTVNPTPTVSLTASTNTICPYSTTPVILNPSPTGGSYTTPGVTSNTIYLTTPGTYSVGYKITSPCPNTATAVFTVFPQQCVITNASPDSICTGQSSTITYTPSGGSLSGPFLSGNVFTPTSAGSYSVTYNYVDTYGCSYSDCESITVNLCTNIKEEILYSLEVFPNPFSNEFTITNPNNVFLNITVYDVTGKLMSKFNTHQTFHINTSEFSSGVYYVQLQSGDYLRSVKLIKL